VGYTEDGEIATHALVFMIRGLYSKWKQAITFFTHNTVAAKKLSTLIQECITRLHRINLFVRCIVCDQAATNVAAVKILGFTKDSPYFTCLDNTVYVIFDVPHLIKKVFETISCTITLRLTV